MLVEDGRPQEAPCGRPSSFGVSLYLNSIAINRVPTTLSSFIEYFL